MSYNVVDAGVLVIVLVSLSIGAWRGFLYEVFSLVGWVVAFISARWLAADVVPFLPLDGVSDGLRYAAAFVVVFVAAAFAAGLVSWLIRKLAAQVGLRPVDRVLGAVFGLVRASALLLILAFGVSLTPLAKNEAWTQSGSAQFLAAMAQQGKPWLPEELLKVLP